MIVAASRIAGDIGAIFVFKKFLFFSIQVVHATGDDPQGAGLELGRVRTKRAVLGHILHLAMPAFCQPLEQPRLGRREVGVGDADRLEAELPAPLPDAPGERAEVHVARV